MEQRQVRGPFGVSGFLLYALVGKHQAIDRHSSSTHAYHGQPCHSTFTRFFSWLYPAVNGMNSGVKWATVKNPGTVIILRFHHRHKPVFLDRRLHVFLPFLLHLLIFFTLYKMSNRTMVNGLPRELVEDILSYLDSSDLASLCAVSKECYHHIVPCLYSNPTLRTRKQLDCLIEANTSTLCYITRLNLSTVHEFVTDKHLAQLASSPKQEINLANCKAVSSSAINCLLRISVPYVESVVLTNCTLTTETLSILRDASNCRLRMLNLGNTMIAPCRSIDAPNDLEALICPGSSSQLQELDLSYCSWVNSQTLNNIGQGLPCLTRLSLCWCQQVQPASLRRLLEQLKQLIHLNVQFVSGVRTALDAKELWAVNANLKELKFTDRLVPTLWRRC